MKVAVSCSIEMGYHSEELRQEIRKLRGKFYSHSQIIEALKIPERTYYYHWNIIKQENAKIYDKLTEENIREDIERTIEGLERNIQRLQGIIDKSEDEELVRRAIETQSELMSAIPRQRQDGGKFIEEIKSGDTDRGKQEEDRQQVKATN